MLYSKLLGHYFLTFGVVLIYANIVSFRNISPPPTHFAA